MATLKEQLRASTQREKELVEEVDRLNNEIEASEKKLKDLEVVWTMKSRIEMMQAPTKERAIWNPAAELDYL